MSVNITIDVLALSILFCLFVTILRGKSDILW